ncbi:MAG: PAS domain-containing protein [Anaerolineales bacterium]
MSSQSPFSDPNFLGVDLYEHAPVGYLVLSKDGRIGQVNRTTCVMLQLDADDLHQQPLANYIAPTDLREFTRFMRRLDAGPQAIELRLQQPSGDVFYTRLQGPLGQVQGPNAAGYVLAITNITETELARRAGLRMRRYFENITDTVQEGVLVLDDTLHIQVANRAYCQTFGHAPAELLGKTLFEVGGPTWESSALRELLEQVYRDGTPIRQYEVNDTFPNLGKRSMMINAHRFQVLPGQDAILMAFHDITELKEFQARQEEIRQNLALALRGAPLVLLTQDTELRYTWMYTPLEGLDTPVSIGKRDREIMQNAREAEYLETIKQAVLDTGEPRRETVRITICDEPTWFDILLEPMYADDGTIIGLRTAAVNVTGSYLAAERAARLQALASHLAKAHDLASAIDIINRYTGEIIGAQYVGIALQDEDSTLLNYYAAENVGGFRTHPPRQIPIDDRMPIIDAAREGKMQWFGDYDSYTQAYDGHALADVPIQPATVVALPLHLNEQVLGAIGLSFTEQQPGDEQTRAFFAAVAAHCAVAIDRAHLQERDRENAVVQERERISRELHDAVSQSLYSARVIADALNERLLDDGDNPTLTEYLTQLDTSIRNAQSELRMLLVELRPEHIIRGELHGHLAELVQAMRSLQQYDIEFIASGEGDPTPEAKFALYRIAQEALNNVTKHAHAAHVVVRLHCDGATYHLTIEDDGDGFEATSVTHGLGLDSMRERAEAAGGQLSIYSQPGKGTRIILRI